MEDDVNPRPGQIRNVTAATECFLVLETIRMHDDPIRRGIVINAGTNNHTGKVEVETLDGVYRTHLVNGFGAARPRPVREINFVPR